MAIVKVLARNWKIEIDKDPLAGTPTGTQVWQKIGGINTFTITSDKEDADTTDFDSEGYNTHIVASRSNEITFEGFFLEDSATGARDPGQQAVEDYADKIGHTSIATIRMTSPSGKVTEYDGSIGIGDVGGGTNDPTSWGATVAVSGKPTKITP